jgi:hypothetical protein
MVSQDVYWKICCFNIFLEEEEEEGKIDANLSSGLAIQFI